MICLKSIVSPSQVGWQAVIICIDERLWKQSRGILMRICLQIHLKILTYLLKQHKALNGIRLQTTFFGVFLCFSVYTLSFFLSFSLLFPWKLASRWRGWRESGRQTRTSGPVWSCVVPGLMGELGSLHCSLTKLIKFLPERFMFCLLNSSPPSTATEIKQQKDAANTAIVLICYLWQIRSCLKMVWWRIIA